MKINFVFIFVVVFAISAEVPQSFAQSRGGRRQGGGGGAPPRGESPAESALSIPSSALDHFKNGSISFIKGDYKLAIESYNKALDLEKKKPSLEKTLWYALINNLGLSYGLTGNPKKEKEIFVYGLSKDPKYPLFYYYLACATSGIGDLDDTLSNLKLAFEYKENLIPGEKLPDPADDDRLFRFRRNDRFESLLKELP